MGAPSPHLHKGVLNLLQLGLECTLHFHKLAAHVVQQGVDVLGLALECLDKFIILLLELGLDLYDLIQAQS